MAQIAEWRNLSRSLKSGQWSVLDLKRDDDRDNLIRLSQKLNITDPQSNQLTVQSLLSIPLKVGQRTVGLINVGDLSESKEGFSQSQIDLALAIASQATLLIDTKWQEEQLTRRGNLNTAMLQALRHIRQTEGVEELLRVIVKQTVSLFSIPAKGPRPVAGMIIEDSARNNLRWIDSLNESRDLEEANLQKLKGTLGSVATKENSQIVFDFRASEGEEPFLAEYNFNILLATPMTISPDFRCNLFLGDTMDWSHLVRADLEILERLGQHSGISLTKALAQQQAVKTRDGNYLVAEAMAVDELEVMLGKAVQGILKSMDCDTVTLYVLDSKKGRLKFPPELAGVKDKAAALKVLEREKELVKKRVAAIDRYHAAIDTMNDDLLKGEFVRSEGIVSSAAIPIKAQGKKIGVMFVNYRRRHRFDKNDEKNMEFLAHEAAVAISNVQMYNGMKAQQVRLKALYETEHAIATSRDLKSALEIVAEQVWNVASANDRTANVVSINLIENDKAEVIAAHPKEEWEHIRQELNGPVDLINGNKIGLVGVAYNSNKSQIFIDLKRKPNPNHIRLHDKTQSELVSLIWDSEATEKTAEKSSQIVGAITVENSDEDAFDQEDLEVIETLTRQAGVVIANDKQSRQVQELNQENSRLQVMSMMGLSTTIWRHTIHHLAEEIDASAKKGLEERSKTRWPSVRRRDELNEIAGLAKKLMQLPVEVPLSAEEGCKNEIVNEMIEQHLKELMKDKRNSGISIRGKLKLTRGAAIRVNKSWFLAALSIFTQNSLRSLKNSPEKKLHINTTIVDGAMCRVEVSDTGAGMDGKTWATLFDERKKRKEKGMGVGLLNARLIIKTYGGHVHKVANSYRGVTVGFSLPIAPPEGSEVHLTSVTEDVSFNVDSSMEAS
jgi:GAF domain-containing protein